MWNPKTRSSTCPIHAREEFAMFYLHSGQISYKPEIWSACRLMYDYTDVKHIARTINQGWAFIPRVQPPILEYCGTVASEKYSREWGETHWHQFKFMRNFNLNFKISLWIHCFTVILHFTSYYDFIGFTGSLNTVNFWIFYFQFLGKTLDLIGQFGK